ncbi:outer membrane protein [Celeribacter sp.]|uniref:outer membrane protein n=1 Tax=Celeribacter sp. TaxID=1890673 RepID=UPI003A8E0CA5
MLRGFTLLCATAASTFPIVLTAGSLSDPIVEPVPSAPVDAAPQPVNIDWSGAYVGVGLGYGAGDAFAKDVIQADLGTGASIFNSDFSLDGPLGTIHAGYNWNVRQNWILGIEGEVSLAGTVDGSYLATDGRSTVDISYGKMAQLRARLGYTMNRAMFYGAVGLAGAEISIDATHSTGAVFKGDNYQIGGVIGLGVEYALTDDWLLRAEVNYADFGSADYSLEHTGGTYSAAEATGGGTGTLVRLGVSYKF